MTINSVADEMFIGEVTEINRAANAESGVTSYSAVITMPKDPRMLPGMSAKAVVLIEGVEHTILIPESALHQTRDAAFVYTTCDPDTNELGGAVAVIPGLSDGNMVEIIEGLSEGDTVYYTKVWNPWFGYASDGNASDGDAWVYTETFATDGDVYFATDGDVYFATDGDAGK